MARRSRNRSIRGYRSRNRRKAIMRRRLLIGGIVLSALLIIFAGSYFYVRGYVNKQGEDVIYNHIYVDGTDMSGKKEAEAVEILKNHVSEKGEQTLTLKLEEESVEVKFSELGLAMPNMDKLVKDAMSYGKTGNLFSRYSKIKKLEKEKVELDAVYEIDSEQTKTILEKKMEGVETGTKDATIKRENGRFVIKDEVRGMTVDMEKAQVALRAYFEGDWKNKETILELETTVDEPKVTRADLETIQDELGKFTTNVSGTMDRVKNVATGASKVDGKILMPGEELSVGKVTQPYTIENGYAEAGSYLNGEVVQSMGGGICQVSSTLYNAVLRAELEIIQRQPHSMVVAYVNPAADAAIAGDYKDLKFKNNQETPIYIEGYVNGRQLTFVVYGKETRPSNRSITFESETISTKEDDPKFEATSDKIGTLKKTTSEHVGMTTKLWKIVKEDGKETDKVLINNSKYSSSPAVYSVGTKSDSKKATDIVKKAIKTQDKKKIEAAIAQAKALIKDEEAAAKKEQADKEAAKKEES